MTHQNRSFILAGFVLVGIVLAAWYTNRTPPTSEVTTSQIAPADQKKEAYVPLSTEVEPQIVLTESEKETVDEFDKRTKEYAGLHDRLEASLPRLPDEATPEQIDQHQKSMVALILKERKDAKPGDFFTPAMVTLIRRASGATVAGSDGKRNKETIMDENPGALPNVGVNDKYPENVPMTTMPPELLETLPELPEGQEYRFVGKQLVLVDACCSLVLDITPAVLA